MSDPLLIVVHGCARIKQIEVDRYLRSHAQHRVPVVSFTEIVGQRPTGVVLEIHASFYPDEAEDERFQKIGADLGKIVACPVTTFVYNRHPTAVYQAAADVINHHKSVGKL